MALQTPIPDTHHLIVDSVNLTLNQANQSNNALWIALAAVIVSLLSVGATLTQIYFNRKQVREQLRQASLQAQAQLDFSREQFFMQVRSTNRQRWVDELREELAEITGTCTVLFRTVTEAAAQSHAGKSHLEHKSRMLDLRREVESLETRIVLRLNPTEAEHQELSAAANALRRASFMKQADSLESVYLARDARRRTFVECRNRLRVAAKNVLKAEWERVKKGE